MSAADIAFCVRCISELAHCIIPSDCRHRTHIPTVNKYQQLPFRLLAASAGYYALHLVSQANYLGIRAGVRLRPVCWVFC